MRKSLNTEFVQQYRSVFADQLIQRAFQNKSHLSGKDILNLSPVRQLNLFVLRTLFVQWQEEIKRLESPYFDYRNKEVRNALVRFMNLLSQHISIDSENLKTLIEEALEQTLHLAFDPIGFMLKEFGGKTAVLTTKSSEQFLKYIHLHKEHIRPVLSELEGTSQQEITSEVLGPLAELSFDEDELVNQLSEVLIIEGKDLFIQSPKVEEAVAEDEEQLVFQPDVMEESMDEVEDEGSFFEEETSVDEEQDESDSSETHEAIEVSEPATDEEIVEQEDSEEEEAVEHDETEETEITNESDETFESEETVDSSTFDDEGEPEDTPTPTVQSQYESEVKTLADLHEEKGIDSILEAISINHRYMFLQELFEGDNEKFQSAIHEVEEAGSFDDAVQILVQNYAKEYDWDMNSDGVKELLKVIFRKYR